MHHEMSRRIKYRTILVVVNQVEIQGDIDITFYEIAV